MTRIRLSIIVLALAVSASPASAIVNPNDRLLYNIEERDPANEFPMGWFIDVGHAEQLPQIVSED